jgi:hypothetical protein
VTPFPPAVPKHPDVQPMTCLQLGKINLNFLHYVVSENMYFNIYQCLYQLLLHHL